MSWAVYDWLQAEAGQRLGTDDAVPVQRVLLGLNWSLVETPRGAGLCFSPVDAPRTLTWPGTLRGRPARELIAWLRSWNACEAAVAVAALNAAINTSAPVLGASLPLVGNWPPHLRVFEHFRPQLTGARVVVIGRYPGLEQYFAGVEYACIERRPQAGDLPDTAADYLLPAADWVFVTASSIANKTLPHLLSRCARTARVVLMGPSLPWLQGWCDFGVTHLAGIEIVDRVLLSDVVAEGGGTRIFAAAVRYRLHEL